MTEISELKSAARQAAFARRKSAVSAPATLTANQHLAAHLATLSGIVSGYMAIRTEIDPVATMAEIARSRTLCVPVVQGPGLPLAFNQWTPDTEMMVGAFGARIPAQPVVLIPAVLIVPLAAFDGAGYRLGYGGGFYDRSLELLRKSGPVHAVGFAYSAQATDDLPIESTDQPLDAIVTELGVQTF